MNKIVPYIQYVFGIRESYYAKNLFNQILWCYLGGIKPSGLARINFSEADESIFIVGECDNSILYQSGINGDMQLIYKAIEEAIFSAQKQESNV